MIKRSLRRLFLYLGCFRIDCCFLINYLYWFRWLDKEKNLAFEKQVEQMLILACKKSNKTTVKMLKSAK